MRLICIDLPLSISFAVQDCRGPNFEQQFEKTYGGITCADRFGKHYDFSQLQAVICIHCPIVICDHANISSSCGDGGEAPSKSRYKYYYPLCKKDKTRARCSKCKMILHELGPSSRRTFENFVCSKCSRLKRKGKKKELNSKRYAKRPDVSVQVGRSVDVDGGEHAVIVCDDIDVACVQIATIAQTKVMMKAIRRRHRPRHHHCPHHQATRKPCSWHTKRLLV